MLESVWDPNTNIIPKIYNKRKQRAIEIGAPFFLEFPKKEIYINQSSFSKVESIAFSDSYRLNSSPCHCVDGPCSRSSFWATVGTLLGFLVLLCFGYNGGLGFLFLFIIFINFPSSRDNIRVGKTSLMNQYPSGSVRIFFFRFSDCFWVGFLYFQDDNAISDLCVLNVSVGFRLISNFLVTIWMNLAWFWLVCFEIQQNFVFINSWIFGGSVSF